MGKGWLTKIQVEEPNNNIYNGATIKSIIERKRGQDELKCARKVKQIPRIYSSEVLVGVFCLVLQTTTH